METMSQIKSKIAPMRDGLNKKYHVKSIAIFGSFARNEQNENSDVDILVEFSQSLGVEFIDLADELEKVLNRKVDLVSKKGIKEKYLKLIEPELSYVWANCA
ncbi:MAG: nucleotidyltransferase family protein [Deltaproteobacteria bacterium]